jgi:hypothetical protein
MSDRIEELEAAIRNALVAMDFWLGCQRAEIPEVNRILSELEAALIDDDTLITLTVRDEDRLS